MKVLEVYYRIRIGKNWFDDLGGTCESRAHAAIFQTPESAKTARWHARRGYKGYKIRIVRVSVKGVE